MKRASAAPIEAPILLSEIQAAELCGISYWAMRELTAAGEIPLVRFPNPLNPRRTMRRKLIDRSDLMRYIEKCKVAAP
jgi:hypothetical protein